MRRSKRVECFYFELYRIMDLSDANKTHIDSLGVYDLLYKVRFASIGDEWFQGETGEYWVKRLSEVRAQDNDVYVRASKDMGWS